MSRGRLWLVTAATAVGVAATGGLGYWQLDRAHQKLALQAAIEQRKALPALDHRSLLATKNIAELLHREVILRGSWAAAQTVFLDNRQMRGKPGFYVVTPLRLQGSAAAVLVQRGWAPRNFTDRMSLPALETPDGEVEVRGRIAPPPARLYEFSGAPGGVIRQNLDLVAFRAETGLALLEFSVQQAGAASQGLLREWPPAASGVEKNYGYAFQWWALSGLITILYVWFQFVAPAARPLVPDQPLGLTVHSLPLPHEAGAGEARRTARGRRLMLAVLAVCAAPVVASYLTYYFVRPEGRRNFGELIEPQRPLPAIAATTLDGKTVPLVSLKGQWLLVSVAAAACDAACEKHLYLQRQLREGLNKDKDRLDWVWLIPDTQPVRDALAPALRQATALRIDAAQLAQWLVPAAGHQLPAHLYVVDPMGNWMMRFPASLDQAGAVKAKRDLERLMRASGSWDQPGRLNP